MSESNDRGDGRINIDQVVAYLNRAFSKAQLIAIQNLKNVKNQKGTVLYEYQVEFSYLVDDIQRGPTYIAPKLIQKANELIEKLKSETGE